MSENIQEKRVHPWKMAEEWAQNPIKSFNVVALPVNPLMVAQFTKPTNRHPFLANCGEVN